MPGYRLSAWLRPLLTLVALAGVLSLAACGGGNGAPNNPYQGGAGPLAITPSVATAYSGNPFVFAVTGGNQPYTIITSDQAALPVVGTLNGNTLVVVPGNVGADTAVTLTVRDASGTSATALVTVKPALLLPASITITGNPNCAASGADLCSGQDGTATVTVTGPAGAPLAGRQVRFDVVQGTYSISAPGQPLLQSLTVTTDQNGTATVRLVVPTTAATQIATIRATELEGGSSVLGQFTIAQFVNGNSVLTIIPTGTTTFTGPDNAHCAGNSSHATFYIFGGTPPYTVATNFPTAVTLSGVPVLQSGNGFTVTPNGQCFTNLTFAIVDATGRVPTNAPTVSNVFGTAPAPVPIVPLQVTAGQNTGTPTQRVSCAGTFTFIITGKAPFSAVASAGTPNPLNGIVTTSPGNFSVSGLPAATDVTITIADSNSPAQTDLETIYCQ